MKKSAGSNELDRLRDELATLKKAVEPFMRYYDDIRFNLRKQPYPSDAAIEERGERYASVSWAEFYKLADALRPTLQKNDL